MLEPCLSPTEITTSCNDSKSCAHSIFSRILRPQTLKAALNCFLLMKLNYKFEVWFQMILDFSFPYLMKTMFKSDQLCSDEGISVFHLHLHKGDRNKILSLGM